MYGVSYREGRVWSPVGIPPADTSATGGHLEFQPHSAQPLTEKCQFRTEKCQFSAQPLRGLLVGMTPAPRSVDIRAVEAPHAVKWWYTLNCTQIMRIQAIQTNVQEYAW